MWSIDQAFYWIGVIYTIYVFISVFILFPLTLYLKKKVAAADKEIIKLLKKQKE